MLQLAVNVSGAGKPIGVYIETKGPAFHDALGLPLEAPLLDALEAAGLWRRQDIPIVLQSFEEQACTCLHAVAPCQSACAGMPRPHTASPCNIIRDIALAWLAVSQRWAAWSGAGAACRGIGVHASSCRV